jgi:RHS repeat-associated protein
MEPFPSCHPDARKDLGLASTKSEVEIPPDVGMTTMREGEEGIRGMLVADHRYEYDGLNLLRVDELYDSDSDGLDGDDLAADAWRALWVGTYRPGSLGALLHKSVYVYSDLEDNTADSANEYTYTYDPVGNVACVYDQSGNLAYEFAQDAFGNELPVGTLGGSDWHDAAGDGIVEHQTGKWMDEFTGLYYFQARWYCGEVGSFVSRYPLSLRGLYGQYQFTNNNPISFVDPTGEAPGEFLDNKPIQACSRAKDSNAGPVRLPGRHCFLCWDDRPPWTSNPDACEGCQRETRDRPAGAYPEKPVHPVLNPDCDSLNIDECTLTCMQRVFRTCCSDFQTIRVLTNNCCDCARKAFKQCGFSRGSIPDSIRNANVGL